MHRLCELELLDVQMRLNQVRRACACPPLALTYTHMHTHTLV